MTDATDEADRRIINEMIGRFDSPSFIRRAKLVETTWTQLLDRCAKARLDRLKFTALRLGQLRDRAGSWDALRPLLPRDGDLSFLQSLHAELQPRLLLPLAPTTSRRVLLATARELVEVMEIFNQRWTRWLAKVDLRAVNQARLDYNRYYLFEKECAVGSAIVARMGFRILEPITPDDVAAQFPLLPIPVFIC